MSNYRIVPEHNVWPKIRQPRISGMARRLIFALQHRRSFMPESDREQLVRLQSLLNEVLDEESEELS